MDSDRYLTASNRFGMYCVPVSSRHRAAAAVVLAGNVWEPRTIDFMIANCGNGDIIHAGTYFGDFLPALSRALDAEALLWAFEPNKENCECASKTVELNRLANVRLEAFALGAKTETMLLKVRGTDGSASGGVSRLVHRQKPGASYEEAKVIAGDDVVPDDRTVSILQLDVEGFELDALSGLLATIRRCRPIILLEHIPEETWFAQNILALDYALQGRVHANWIVAPVGTQLAGPFQPAEKAAATAEARLRRRREHR